MTVTRVLSISQFLVVL